MKRFNAMQDVAIKQVVYTVLADEMALNPWSINDDELLGPLADTDDWSLIFIPEVEKRLGRPLPINAWSKLGTINEITRYFQRSDDA